MNTNNYRVTLILAVNGQLNESTFECADIKVGERFLSFEMEPTTTNDGINVDSVNTKNFPYEHIIQFDVKKANNG